MGDRSNIAVQYNSGETIYLYGHWTGDQNLTVVLEAIREGRRLNDESYFARILFSKLVSEDLTGEVGFGVAPYRIDDEHPLVTVCPSEGWIEVEGQARVPFTEVVHSPQFA